MRLRPPSVRRVSRRLGLVVPAALAVGLALVGHEVSAPAAKAATVAIAPEPTVASETPAATSQRNSVARKQLPKRASRSTSRTAVRKPAWVRPSSGALTSRYGARWGRMHRGIDLGAAYGSPIYAAAAGTVSFAGAQGGYGRLVTIRHADGYTTAYGHMSRTVVRSGQRVSAGQVIAYVGSEGRSTGPHLHFEVRRGGAYLDPLPFLRARNVWI